MVLTLFPKHSPWARQGSKHPVAHEGTPAALPTVPCEGEPCYYVRFRDAGDSLRHRGERGDWPWVTQSSKYCLNLERRQTNSGVGRMLYRSWSQKGRACRPVGK